VLSALNTGLQFDHRQYEDSCPPSHFCAIHGSLPGAKARLTGHCCPRPAPVCPLGRPLHSTSCSFNRPCPSSHYCHRILEPGRTAALVSVCCPVACKDRQSVYHSGRCLPIAALEDTCEASVQCPAGSVCGAQGKCDCERGAVKSGGQCEKVKCAGAASPLLNLRGDMVKCDNSSSCGDTGYCKQNGRICCPLPELHCPKGYSPGPERVECGYILSPTGPRCADGFNCHPVYRATDFTRGGICCKRDNSTAPAVSNDA
jgi:hypothetical protein